MPVEFSQRQRNFKVKVILHDAFLEYQVTRMHEEKEVFIPYEKLSNDTVTRPEKYGIYLFLAYLFLFGMFGALSPYTPFHSNGFAVLLGAGALIDLFMYWYTRNKLIMIAGEKQNVYLLAKISKAKNS